MEAEEIMAKNFPSKHNGMDVNITLEDEDDADFGVSVSDVGSLSGGGDFTLLKGIADIKFTSKTGQGNANSQARASFKRSVRIEISFTDEVVQALQTQGKTLSDLELGYLVESSKGSGSGTWFAFSDPNGIPKVRTQINEKKKTGTVVFSNWLMDPPVGWGFK